jgi:hypothetical protein
VRPSSAILSSSDEPGATGAGIEAGEELVVSEAEAAELLRFARRAVELVEVIDDQPMEKKRLPG